MNTVPNSDSKKCPESKLSRVHSAPTLGLAYTRNAPRPTVSRRVVARTGVVLWSCLGRVTACGQPCCRCVAARTLPCRSSPQSRYKFVSQPSSLLRAVSRAHNAVSRAHSAVSRAHSAASWAVSQLVSLPLLRHKCRPKPRYNLCIATLSASQATRTRARLYRARCAPYCGAC